MSTRPTSPRSRGRMRALWVVPLLALGVHAADRGLHGAPGLDRPGIVRAAAPQMRAELVQRWAQLSESERSELQERYQRYQELEPDYRQVLLEGGRRLDGEARRIYSELGAEDRSRLDALAPGERRAELRIMAAEELRELGRVVLDSLPAELRQRYLGASLDDRLRLLKGLARRQEAALGDAMLELSEMLGLDEERRDRLRSLSPERGRKQFLVLLRDYVEREARRRGASQPVPDKAWQDLAEMDGSRLLATVLRLRAAHPDYWPRLGATKRLEDPKVVRTRMRLRLAQRPDPREHVELLDRSREEREKEKLARRRERMLQVLVEEGIVDASRQEDMRALSAGQFFRAVRSELQPQGRPAADKAERR